MTLSLKSFATIYLSPDNASGSLISSQRQLRAKVVTHWSAPVPPSSLTCSEPARKQPAELAKPLQISFGPSLLKMTSDFRLEKCILQI